QSWKKSNNDIFILNEYLHNSQEKVSNPQLYKKFLWIIEKILYYCQKLKLKQDNKVFLRYKKLQDNIANSSNPNKYVIDLLLKYSKIDFKPQLYKEKPELLFPIFKLEKYFKHIGWQIPDYEKYNT
ncbi:7378_t:CDS:1, partial [Dentiscutata heterogama]